MSTPAANPNAGIITAWNTILFEKFSRFRHLIIDGLGEHGAELFRRYGPEPGARVLDVGCGFGDTCVALGRLVGPEGEVVGVDCAENFVRAGEAHAREQGADNVRFLCADVQLDPLEGPYDAVYSRFGTMFFTAPVAALRNIRSAMRPGARLAMSVWRTRVDNPGFYVPQQVVERFIRPEDKATDQLTCGPGPFSMAGADMVSAQLLASGFTDISFLRFDAPMCIGHSVEEALRFTRELGPAGEAIRLAADKAAHEWEAIEAALLASFEPFVRDDGVWATTSTWLITATATDDA